MTRSWWIGEAGLLSGVLLWMALLALTIPSPLGDGQSWPVQLGASGAALLLIPAAMLAAATPWVAHRVGRSVPQPLVVTGVVGIVAGLAGNAVGSLVAQGRFWPGLAVDPWSTGWIGLVVGNPADATLVAGALALAAAGGLWLARHRSIGVRVLAVALALGLVLVATRWGYAPLRTAELTAWAVI